MFLMIIILGFFGYNFQLQDGSVVLSEGQPVPSRADSGSNFTTHVTRQSIDQ